MEDLLKLDNVLAGALLLLSWMWFKYSRARDKTFTTTFEKIDAAQVKRSENFRTSLDQNTKMLGRNLEVLGQLKDVIETNGFGPE